MRTITAFILLWGLFAASVASGQMLLTGAGAQKIATGGGGYQGPGDVVTTGWVAYFSSASCFKNSLSANFAIMDVSDSSSGGTGAAHGTRRVCNSGVVTDLSSSTACTWVTGNICSPLTTTCATACYIQTFYDQIGTGCGGSNCNLTLQGPADPVILTGALSAYACANSPSGSSSIMQSANNLTQSQPFTITTIAKRVSGTADVFGVVRNSSSTTGTIRAGYGDGTNVNKANMYAGASVPAGATATDGHFHSLAYVFADPPAASPNSGIYVDNGSLTSLSLGTTTGFSGSDGIGIFYGAANTTAVVACEFGIYNGEMSNANATALYNNAVTRFGSLP